VLAAAPSHNRPARKRRQPFELDERVAEDRLERDEREPDYLWADTQLASKSGGALCLTADAGSLRTCGQMFDRENRWGLAEGRTAPCTDDSRC